jgi:hypothetical protein
MLRTERSAGTVIVAACLFIMWSVAPRAQDAPAGVKASPADVGAVKISGAWQLNKALSTAPPEKAAAPPSGNSGGSAGGRGGRGTGGGNNSTSKNNGLSQAQMSLIAALIVWRFTRPRPTRSSRSRMGRCGSSRPTARNSG